MPSIAAEKASESICLPSARNGRERLGVVRGSQEGGSVNPAMVSAWAETVSRAGAQSGTLDRDRRQRDLRRSFSFAICVPAISCRRCSRSSSDFRAPEMQAALTLHSRASCRSGSRIRTTVASSNGSVSSIRRRIRR